MATSPDQHFTLGAAAGGAFERYLRFVHRTSTVLVEPAPGADRLMPSRPAILAIWLGQHLMLPALYDGTVPLAALASRSGGSSLTAAVLSRFGIRPILSAGKPRLQSPIPGMTAFRRVAQALAAGECLAMTADASNGPARRAGLGIVQLARITGCPIYPVAAAASRYTTLGRVTLALPFGRLACVVGEPMHVARDAVDEALEAQRRSLEQALFEVTRRAHALAGGDPARATLPGWSDPLAPPLPPGIRLKAYRAATTLLRPVAPLLLKRRELQGKENPRRRGERLGQASAARPDGPVAWVHAASVGETNAVLPLMERLSEARTSLGFVLTTGTVTSADLAAGRLGPRAVHQYVPLDAPEYARRFLGHWRPDVAIFTESEIWPNLILETSVARVPIALVNGRMSQRSFTRWQRNLGLAGPLFNRMDLVLAQTEEFADRFAALGARRVLTAGNLKIDAPPPPVNAAELVRLQAALGRRPVIVAASTHDGEERLVAEAHRWAAQEIGGLITILAPRHPERGTAIAEELKGLGLSVAQRSLGALPSDTCDVYVADTIGELGIFYAVAPIAFIGGSLVDRGGQNPIEAIRHGTVVVTGPYWRNFQESYAALLHHKAVLEVGTSDELAQAIIDLLRSEQEQTRMRAAASVALESMGGALDRTIAALLPYLPESEGLRRAS